MIFGNMNYGILQPESMARNSETINSLLTCQNWGQGRMMEGSQLLLIFNVLQLIRCPLSYISVAWRNTENYVHRGNCSAELQGVYILEEGSLVVKQFFGSGPPFLKIRIRIQILLRYGFWCLAKKKFVKRHFLIKCKHLMTLKM